MEPGGGMDSDVNRTWVTMTGTTRSRSEHDALTTLLHTKGLASSLVGMDRNSFYAAISKIPGHKISSESVREVRIRASRLLLIRWYGLSDQERETMRDRIGMQFEEYIRGLEGDCEADEVAMETISMMAGGSIAIWSPGLFHGTPLKLRHETAAEAIVANVQWVNQQLEGELNHYEPLTEVRDLSVPKPKQTAKRKRVSKGERKGGDSEKPVQGSKSTGAVLGNSLHFRQPRSVQEQDSSERVTPDNTRSSNTFDGSRI
eukprot:1568507-Rhodomonas_salina.1